MLIMVIVIPGRLHTSWHMVTCRPPPWHNPQWKGGSNRALSHTQTHMHRSHSQSVHCPQRFGPWLSVCLSVGFSPHEFVKNKLKGADGGATEPFGMGKGTQMVLQFMQVQMDCLLNKLEQESEAKVGQNDAGWFTIWGWREYIHYVKYLCWETMAI